jgi:competence protein ComEA
MQSRRRFLIGAIVALSGSLAMRAQPSAKPQVPEPQDRVDINHATIDQLKRIPGMTDTWAARIVRFRPYRAKNDLLDRGIVSSEVYQRIKDYIVAHRDDR